MGELFEKSSPTPSQKLSHKNSQIELLVHKQTVSASATLAFAPASG